MRLFQIFRNSMNPPKAASFSSAKEGWKPISSILYNINGVYPDPRSELKFNLLMKKVDLVRDRRQKMEQILKLEDANWLNFFRSQHHFPELIEILKNMNSDLINEENFDFLVAMQDNNNDFKSLCKRLHLNNSFHEISLSEFEALKRCQPFYKELNEIFEILKKTPINTEMLKVLAERPNQIPEVLKVMQDIHKRFLVDHKGPEGLIYLNELKTIVNYAIENERIQKELLPRNSFNFHQPHKDGILKNMQELAKNLEEAVAKSQTHLKLR